MSHIYHRRFSRFDALHEASVEEPLSPPLDTPTRPHLVEAEFLHDTSPGGGTANATQRWIRYSLVCHESATRVTVGSNGVFPGEMISALLTDEMRESVCLFLMHNRGLPLYLEPEEWGAIPRYADYREFLPDAPGDSFTFECEVRG